MSGSDLYYRETLQPADSEARRERGERADRVCDRTPPPERPDVEQGHAYRLRKLAATFIEEQTRWQARANGEGSWRTQCDDGEEIKQLCREAAEALIPFINRALMAAERHEALSNVCVNHQEVQT